MCQTFKPCARVSFSGPCEHGVPGGPDLARSAGPVSGGGRAPLHRGRAGPGRGARQRLQHRPGALSPRLERGRLRRRWRRVVVVLLIRGSLRLLSICAGRRVRRERRCAPGAVLRRRAVHARPNPRPVGPDAAAQPCAPPRSNPAPNSLPVVGTLPRAHLPLAPAHAATHSHWGPLAVAQPRALTPAKQAPAHARPYAGAHGGHRVLASELLLPRLALLHGHLRLPQRLRLQQGLRRRGLHGARDMGRGAGHMSVARRTALLRGRARRGRGARDGLRPRRRASEGGEGHASGLRTSFLSSASLQ